MYTETVCPLRVAGTNRIARGGTMAFSVRPQHSGCTGRMFVTCPSREKITLRITVPVIAPRFFGVLRFRLTRLVRVRRRSGPLKTRSDHRSETIAGRASFASTAGAIVAIPDVPFRPGTIHYLSLHPMPVSFPSPDSASFDRGHSRQYGRFRSADRRSSERADPSEAPDRCRCLRPAEASGARA